MEIYIARNGQQAGPFSEEQLKSMIQSGIASLNDQAWHQELSEWTPLHRVLKLCPPVPPVQQPPQISFESVPVVHWFTDDDLATPAPPQISFESVPVAQSIAHSGAPAGFWRRLGASLIDYIIICVFWAVIEAFISGSNASWHNVDNAVMLVELVVAWLYSALMESSSTQATLGKLACGLAVTDLSGQRINFGKASGRYFAHFIPAIFLGLGFFVCLGIESIQDRIEIIISYLILSVVFYGVGFLMCLWTKRKQCLPDMIARCLVVTKSSTPR